MQEEHEKELLALKVNQKKYTSTGVYCGYGKFWQLSVLNDKINLLRGKEDVFRSGGQVLC